MSSSVLTALIIPMRAGEEKLTCASMRISAVVDNVICHRHAFQSFSYSMVDDKNERDYRNSNLTSDFDHHTTPVIVHATSMWQAGIATHSLLHVTSSRWTRSTQEQAQNQDQEQDHEQEQPGSVEQSLWSTSI